MASRGKPQQSKAAKDPYCLNRDAKESSRLNLQHKIIVESCGFLIHPIIMSSIFASRPSVVQIADFATGTAIWPRDVAELFANSWPHIKVEIEGFDISTEQFPPSTDNLPNVKLMRHDVLQPMKDKYHSKYDCIHVRALATALEDDQWATVIGNLKRCLKPGGWLLWIDPDMSTRGWKSINLPTPQPTPFSPYVPLSPVNSLLSFQIPNPLQVGITIVNKWAYSLGRHLSSSNRLSDFFAENDLQQIRHEHIPAGGYNLESQKAVTEETASGIAAIIQKFAKMLGEEVYFDPDIVVREMMECCEEGLVWTRLDLNVVIGRKSGWTDLPRGVVITENVCAQLPGHPNGDIVDETFRKGPIPGFEEYYQETYDEDDRPGVGDMMLCTTMEGFDKGLVRKRVVEEDIEEEKIWSMRFKGEKYQFHQKGHTDRVPEGHEVQEEAQGKGNFKSSGQATPPDNLASAAPEVSNSHQEIHLQGETREGNPE